MKYIYPILGVAGLSLLLVAAILFFTSSIDAEKMKDLMLIGTVVWFAAAIPWLGKKKSSQQ